ncbi:hypothetical protein [Streptomyces sedi]|uniref:Uncharacterized protein n=1 Tax=Streptomyces sedi TaxID=555059 RepID=A0A5C4UWE9_9ACTN|nr:hypothetical protein [Streptomyces sedi]TNM27980.1 hypothetical protein FH715_19565 [Streptomyces sedi]
MTTDPEFVFEQVQIGKGLRPLAQHGFLVVDRGTLTLLDSERQPIDSGPLHQVVAKKIRFTGGKSVSLTVNGTKYNAAPGWGARGVFVLPGDSAHVKSAAEALLHLVATGGGQVG